MNDINDSVANDYIRLLIRFLSEVDVGSPRARLDVYARFEKTLTARLYVSDQPYHEETIDYHRKLLQTAVKLVEQDIRGGLDCLAPDYFPVKFADADNRLRDRLKAQAHRRLVAEKRALAAAEEASRLEIEGPRDEAAAVHVASLLRFIDMLAPPATARPSPLAQLRIVRALFIAEMQTIVAEGRIALIWMFVQPAALLTVISLVYFVVSTRYILNMDVPTFALLGSSTWIMCRQVIFRVSGSFASRRFLFSLPPVRSIETALVQGLLYMLIYTCVFLLLTTLGHIVGLVTTPAQPLKVIAYLIGMWLFAFSTGLIFGSIAVVAPLFSRFASIIERILLIFSSVFFVSEQLPEVYKPYVLWSPTAHGMQLLRAGYFEGYDAPDASPLYFIACIACLIAVGLACERVVRPRIHPA